MKVIRFILMLVCSFTLGYLTPAIVHARDDKPKEETFKDPRQGKQRLAYCYTPDKDCGKKTADEYCKLKGYKTSKEFKVLHQDKGKVKASRYLGSDDTCKKHGCDIFESITCRMGPPTFF